MTTGGLSLSQIEIMMESGKKEDGNGGVNLFFGLIKLGLTLYFLYNFVLFMMLD